MIAPRDPFRNTRRRQASGRLTYIETLAALLGMLGRPVSVMLMPAGWDLPAFAVLRGTLWRAEPVRTTLGGIPEAPDDEQLFFPLSDDGETGFSIQFRQFGGAIWDRTEPTVLRVLVGANELWIAPDHDDW